MRTQTERERQAAAETLKEVMLKLEEALRLSQQRDREHDCSRSSEHGEVDRG